jgi:hypothetical protein
MELLRLFTLGPFSQKVSARAIGLYLHSVLVLLSKKSKTLPSSFIITGGNEARMSLYYVVPA